MIRIFSLLIFLTIIIIAMLSLKPDSKRSTESVEGLPWQIEVLPEGRSKVFGVTLGQSTLGDAREQLGEDMTLAIIVAPGQGIGALEMFYSRYKAGVFSGKLVLAADLEPETVAQLMERAVKAGYMDSGARKFTLHPEDLPVAFQAPLASMAFIPTMNIDEASAIKRFGPATETIRASEQVAHLLYPDKGLDLIINTDGKEVLQYVAPRDFERLREPLR
ncbi:hypothetical protein ACFL3A_14080 [Pseudomonadota bacterium]